MRWTVKPHRIMTIPTQLQCYGAVKGPQTSQAYLGWVNSLAIGAVTEKGHVEFCWDVSKCWDFVHARSPSVQVPFRGVAQLLHGEEPNALDKGSFYLQTHPNNKVTFSLLLLFFPAQGQTVTTSTRVFNPPHLTQIPLFISKPLSLLLGTIFAQFLCSHINVVAFPRQVKQFTNTRKQIFHKCRTAIFWWSNRKKKKINEKILISSQAGGHWMSWTCWYIKGQVD